jgi:hypothetical protein
MERIDQNIAKESTPLEDPKRALFNLNAEHARKRGFKPGYASAKYKDKYGEWPPWNWSQALKAEFQKDSEWQQRVKKREAEREHWQRINEEREKQAAEVPDVQEYETSGIDEM